MAGCLLSPPGYVTDALSRLEAAGYEVCLVGGCVRDSLRGETPQDWDIATSALPQQTIQVFSSLPVIPTGLRHGTVTVLVEGHPLEITTYRIDGSYTDGRHPDGVTFTSRLEEDLARRDFTVNALAWNPRLGLVDLYGGQKDLEDRILRCVGEPTRRFEEDALRILRGLRFAATLNLRVEPATWQAMMDCRQMLDRVARERISAELRKLLLGESTGEILERAAPILGVFLPEILPMVGLDQHNPHHLWDVWGHTCRAIQLAPKDSIVREALLFHDIGKPPCFTLDEQGTGHFYGHAQVSAAMAETILTRLRWEQEAIHQITTLIQWHMAQILPTRPVVRRWLNRLGEENFRRLLAVRQADLGASAPSPQGQEEVARLRELLEEVLAEGLCFSRKDLAVTGRDLLALGCPPGPAVGELLAFLLEEVLSERQPNRRDILLDLARTQLDGKSL